MADNPAEKMAESICALEEAVKILEAKSLAMTVIVEAICFRLVSQGAIETRTLLHDLATLADRLAATGAPHEASSSVRQLADRMHAVLAQTPPSDIH